jgi:predicted nucleic-acid-binding Zn-ribbon protein
MPEVKCPKCGSTEITTKYVPKPHPNEGGILLVVEEHLDRTCTCGYAWDDKTLDSEPQPVYCVFCGDTGRMPNAQTPTGQVIGYQYCTCEAGKKLSKKKKKPEATDV